MARTQVQSELIATNAISGTIIADNAITATHIATNSISGTLVQDSGIVTTMIAANNVTAAKIVSDGVETRHLHSNVISGQSSVTAASGDYVLIGDTSDSNNLKKALVSDFGVSGISSSADATAITIGSDEGVTFAAGITSTAAANTLGATSFSEADLTNVGTIYADQYLGDADTDTGIVLPGSNVMTLHTNNAERMRITSDGGVGIGHTGYSSTILSLHNGTGRSTLIYGDSGDANCDISLRDNSSTQNIVYGATGNNHVFKKDTTEVMSIDSEGNISFGTQKQDPNWSQFFNAISGNYGGHVSFQNNSVPVTTLGNNFYINNSTLNERVLAYPSQQFKLDHQQNFLWESAASGTAGDTFSFTEHMRLTSGGVLSIGDATPENGDAETTKTLYLQSGECVMVIKNTDATSGSQRQSIAFLNSSGTRVGTITTTSSATGYATSSDYRLKENVADMTNATTRLKQLKPKRFNWIVDDTNTLVDGFLAHEVSSVVPEAVTGEKDGDEMQGIDQSKLIPLLVKTIQELEARIATLEG